MIENVTRIKHKIGEKDFHFYCDQLTSCAEVREALYHMLGQVCTLEMNAQTQAKPEEDQTNKTDEVANGG
jgi:hypothetical protein